MDFSVISTEGILAHLAGLETECRNERMEGMPADPLFGPDFYADWCVDELVRRDPYLARPILRIRAWRLSRQEASL